MTHDELRNLLKENGFNDGWVLLGNQLTVWEHEQNPPAPLTRPN